MSSKNKLSQLPTLLCFGLICLTSLREAQCYTEQELATIGLSASYLSDGSSAYTMVINEDSAASLKALALEKIRQQITASPILNMEEYLAAGRPSNEVSFLVTLITNSFGEHANQRRLQEIQSSPGGLNEQAQALHQLLRELTQASINHGHWPEGTDRQQLLEEQLNAMQTRLDEAHGWAENFTRLYFPVQELFLSPGCDISRLAEDQHFFKWHLDFMLFKNKFLWQPFAEDINPVFEEFSRTLEDILQAYVEA